MGRDKYADILRSACADAGLHTAYRVDDAQPTGRCGVVITGHDRSMCTHLAAANEYRLEHLKSPDVWSAVQKAGVYYVGGYHLTVCVPAVMALAEEAAEKDKVRFVVFAFRGLSVCLSAYTGRCGSIRSSERASERASPAAPNPLPSAA